MATVDSLDIEISASAAKANAALDALVNRLQKVSGSLQSLNSSGLNNFSNGINNLSKAMQTFNASTKTADFSRLKRNLESLAGIKVSGSFTNLANAMGRLSAAVSATSFAFTGTSTISDFAKNVGKLGSVSVAKAITNMNGLADGIFNMMLKLSRAPRVSQNIIDMTNAMARFASTGSSGARSAIALTKSFDRFSNSTGRATKKSFSLASAIGKLYATYWMLFRAMRGIGKSIDYASQIQEVQNVVDNTFGVYIGKLDAIVNDSIRNLGMSELTVKKIASTYQAMGKAMGFAQNEMSTMSVDLTRLTADMASFYDVSQKDVAEDLQSIFTGMTKPLRQYGLDLTQATLKEYALANGLNADFQNMTQMEKAMLRYQYVMDNTKVAQGDFAKTSGSWANQIRILKENFVSLGNVIGRTFIAALKPLVSALNSVMQVVIQFATLLSNALGQIFGWKFENFSGGSIADPFEDAEDAAGGIADNTGKAADNAKKLKQQLQGIDELNVLNSDKDKGGSGGSGGGGAGSGAESSPAWTTTETIFDYFKSNIKDLESLGNTIRDSLINAMNGIKWDEVYEGARNFGKGLADFLNGLFAKDQNGNTLFGTLTKTIANTLNTALYSVFSFSENFKWDDFGEAVADGINNFFTNFKFDLAAKTIVSLKDGIKSALTSFFKNLSVKDIFSGVGEFILNLDFETVAIALGAFAWTHGGKALTMTMLNNLFSAKILSVFGTGTLTASLGATIGISIVTAVVGFKIGNDLYNKVPTVQECSDSLVELLGDLFTGQISLKELTGAFIDLGFDIQAKIMSIFNPNGQEWSGEDIKNYLLKKLSDFGQLHIDFAVKIASIKDNVQEKWNEFKNWWKTTSTSEKLELAVSLIKNGWTSIKQWLGLSSQDGGDTDKKIGLAKNNWKTVKAWIEDTAQSGLYTAKAIGLAKNNWTSVKAWIENKAQSGGVVSKAVSLAKDFGSKITTVTEWLKSSGTWGDKVEKGITLVRSFIGNHKKIFTTVADWVASYIGGSVQVGIELVKKGWQNFKTWLGLSSGGSIGANGGVRYFADGGVMDKYNFKTFAGGIQSGRPNFGTAFIAGEAGPEIVGHINNRTEVLNESQLASTMYSAVLAAMQAANSNNSGNQPLQVYLDGKVVFDSTRSYASDYTRRTGLPAF